MSKLILEVHVQTYGEDEEETLEKIRDAVIAVVQLCDTAVGTFITSNIAPDDVPPEPEPQEDTIQGHLVDFDLARDMKRGK